MNLCNSLVINVDLVSLDSKYVCVDLFVELFVGKIHFLLKSKQSCLIENLCFCFKKFATIQLKIKRLA